MSKEDRYEYVKESQICQREPGRSKRARNQRKPGMSKRARNIKESQVCQGESGMSKRQPDMSESQGCQRQLGMSKRARYSTGTFKKKVEKKC